MEWRVVLDPNTETQVCMYDGNVAPRGVKVKFLGQWRPGAGHPTWGPEGDPNTPFNGGNKWGVLVTVHYNGARVSQFPYKPDASGWMSIPQNWGFPTSVAAIMNDDRFGDNDFPNPTNPMMGFANPI